MATIVEGPQNKEVTPPPPDDPSVILLLDQVKEGTRYGQEEVYPGTDRLDAS